jgi:hypothetical protein
MATAWMSTSTSSRSGGSMNNSSMTSGAPNSWHTAAFIVNAPSGLVLTPIR